MEKDGEWNRSHVEVRDGRAFLVKIAEAGEKMERVILTIQIDDIIVSIQNYTKRSFPNIDNVWYREVGRVHLGYYDSRVVKK